MKTSIHELETWKKKIDFDVPEEELERAFKEKLKEYKKELKLPGFRPGKVPEPLIINRYGDAIRAEALEDFIKKVVSETIEKNKLIPVSVPEVKDVKKEEGKGISFCVEFEVDPKIDIKDYKDLGIVLEKVEVSEEEVEAGLKELQERLATLEKVDRAIEKEDFVTVEYLKVIMDGQEMKEISSPKGPIQVGYTTSLEGFDESLLGHTTGDVFDVNVKVPDNYVEKKMAGKNLTITLKVTAVMIRKVPEFNEEFLNKMGVKSIDEIRKFIRDDIEYRKKEIVKEKAQEQAIDEIIKKNYFEVPPSRIQSALEYFYEDYKKSNKGSELDDKETFFTKHKSLVERIFKRERILNEIAHKEGIKVSQKEVDDRIASIAAYYQVDFATLKNTFRQKGETLRIRGEILQKKTLDFLIGEYNPQVDKNEVTTEEKDKSEDITK
ncbi:MAG: trigger factor [Chitinispirillaceae bacterium]|nr:trigger factor [Chitinispirillaceae bacterium]